jgi:polyhydroxyalkanoate synthesis regulator phasin
MLFNFATKDDIKALCAFCGSVEAKVQDTLQSLRAQYDLNMSTEDKNRMHIERLEEELKTLQRDYCGQYLRNMELQDKNIRSVQHLEDRILDLENPKPKKKKPAAKAKK